VHHWEDIEEEGGRMGGWRRRRKKEGRMEKKKPFYRKWEGQDVRSARNSGKQEKQSQQNDARNQAGKLVSFLRG
jgi:hypothetical protein